MTPDDVQTDYPMAVSGNITPIFSGSCRSEIKSIIAGHVGAARAIIYNNAPGLPLQGTIIPPPPWPLKDYLRISRFPSIDISRELGTGYVAAIAGDANINATINVTTGL